MISYEKIKCMFVSTETKCIQVENRRRYEEVMKFKFGGLEAEVKDEINKAN